jgi:hypothetical protein
MLKFQGLGEAYDHRWRFGLLLNTFWVLVGVVGILRSSGYLR